MAQIDAVKNELRFNFSSLLPGLQDCRKYHLSPHIIVGQRSQIALANQKEGGVYGVSDWSLYEEYAYAFLKFVMIDQGFSQADFEVANEPDINGASWLLPVKLPSGAPAMYQAYFHLYRAWSAAAARLALEHPELKLRIGGPTIGPFTFAFGKFNWSGQFIRDVAAQKLRLDFLSFHFYGNTESLAGLPPFDPYPPFAERIAYFQSSLKNVGLGNVPIYATEWGPSYVTSETPEGVINGNHVGAAWTARFLMDMVENKVDEGMALTFRDHLDVSNSTNDWGWPSFLLSDGVTPKALYNVALMFSRLPGQRVQTSATKASLGVLASADNAKVAILAFNQDWDYPNTRERANEEQVQVRINGLPFAASKVHMVRYLVDETHSNAHYFYKQGLPITRENSKLQQVEETIVLVTNGIIDLPIIRLAPSSVTLWEITAGNQSAVSVDPAR